MWVSTLGDAASQPRVITAASVHSPHPFGIPAADKDRDKDKDKDGYSSFQGRGDSAPSFQQVVLELHNFQQRLVEAHAQELESLQQDLRALRGDTGGAEASLYNLQAAQRGAQPPSPPPPKFFSMRSMEGEPKSAGSDESALGGIAQAIEASPKRSPLSPAIFVHGEPFSPHSIIGARSRADSVLSMVQELTSQVDTVAQTMDSMVQTKVVFNLCDAWDMDDDQMLEMKCEQLKRKRVSPGQSESERRMEGSQLLEFFSEGERSRCTLHPSSLIKMLWDILLLSFLCYDLVTVPLQVFDLQNVAALRVMDILVVTYWTVDVALSFMTGVYVDGVLVMQTSTIARQYFYSWFFFDFLVLVPEWVTILSADIGEDIPNSMSIMRALRVRRFIRLVRLLKLLRIIKMSHVLEGLKSRIGTTSILLAISMGKLCLITLMLVHDLACLWFLVGNAEGGWVYATGLQERPFQEQYFRSFQWSLSRLHPSSMTQSMGFLTLWQEQALAVLAVSGAMIFSSIFISSITNLMLDMKRMRDKKNQKITAFREYAAKRNISTMLSVRLTRYLEREHDHKMQQQTEQELQEALPQ
ncbi:unnamed protein product, partial [Polarella glacialis]